MHFLIDNNLKGEAPLLWIALTQAGWVELLPIRFVQFEEIDVPLDADDRTVWRLCQAKQMILLTANRNMDGQDSLEQTLRDEGIPSALPVVTISNRDRIRERAYRERCVERLVEIVLNLEHYLGVTRIYVP